MEIYSFLNILIIFQKEINSSNPTVDFLEVILTFYQ